LLQLVVAIDSTLFLLFSSGKNSRIHTLYKHAESAYRNSYRPCIAAEQLVQESHACVP